MSLKHFDYCVAIYVKGLYIGSPSELRKVASLQMRVVQIQYLEVNICSLSDPIPGANNLSSTSNTQAMQPATPPVPSHGQSTTTTTVKKT